MMGSVHARVKEIGVYTAVGLAPNHVAMLFIGEAAVFAILGAILGYLLGQVVAKALIAFDMLAGLTLNYSSLSAMFSSALVMGVVLASAVYPAKKAAALAVPDVTRRWTIPPPEGDRWVFPFPFTVGQSEVVGLFAFLRDFFSFYTEESIGTFYTDGAELSRLPRKTGFQVEATMWLAPFDLGVKQTLRLQAAPTEEGIYEIQVVIVRMEGDVAAWTRINRSILNIVRKAFLVWRTVSPEGKADYHRQGEETLLREPKS